MRIDDIFLGWSEKATTCGHAEHIQALGRMCVCSYVCLRRLCSVVIS